MRLLLGLALALALPLASAAPGSLDPTFGIAGQTRVNFSDLELSEARAVAIQPDGRIVAAGVGNNGFNSDIALARYNTDGSLDDTFGLRGRAHFASAAQIELGIAIAIQSNGKILVAGSGAPAGSIDRHMILVRFNADGSPDTAFGTGGVVYTILGSHSAIISLALQADGKIVAAGSASFPVSSNPFVVVRYLANGALDASFATGGVAQVTFGLFNESASSVVVEPGGAIVVAGSGDATQFAPNSPPPVVQAAVARFDANGALDATFDGDGKTVVPLLEPNESVTSVVRVARQGDGKYVLSLSRRGNNGSDIAVLRLLSGGGLDSGFGSGGKSILAIDGADEYARGLALQADGSIVVAGSTLSGYMIVARFTASGLVDATWAGTGYTTILFSSTTTAEAVALQADGKVVAAGAVTPGLGSIDGITRFAIARLDSSGALDGAFGSGGKVQTLVGSGSDIGQAILALPDNRLLVLGTREVGLGARDHTISRYTANGILDRSFAGSGAAFTPITDLIEVVAMARQADGAIVSVGSVLGPQENGPILNTNTIVVRHDASGALDASFGGSGVATIDYGPATYGYGIAVQSDQKIVVAGSGFSLARLNADGTPDPTFNGTGRAMLAIPGALGGEFRAIVVQPDGKLVVAGIAFLANGARPVVARINANGSLDASFGSGGSSLYTFANASTEAAYALALYADGRILVGGAYTPVSMSGAGLIRLNANGSLDTTFGNGGVATILGEAGAKTLAIQATGKILAGMFNFRIVRFTASGAVDSGYISQAVGMAGQFAYGSRGIAVQSSGKVVLAGQVADGRGYDHLLARFEAGESPDDADSDGVPNTVELAEGLNPGVKDNDVFASTAKGARLFAMQQYRDFLSREGDADGITAWTNYIMGGGARAATVEGFLSSGEFQGFVAPVTRLYFAFFLRIPDYPGLTFWIDYFRQGNSLQGIASAFAGSSEFTDRYGTLTNGQFVDLVYQNVLGRPADPGGKAYWQANLDSGMPRGTMMIGFSESAEYVAAIRSEVNVTMTYIGMLRRSPDGDGFSFWVNYLDGGQSLQALINGFLLAPEYRSRFLP